MKRLFIIFSLLVCVVLTSCTQPNKTVSLLEDMGYTNIQTGGFAPFACSEDDFFATNFTATTPTGATINGVVCSGTFKGSTVRFY